jgi:uncharacterized protein YbaR (Trm112 family)
MRVIHHSCRCWLLTVVLLGIGCGPAVDGTGDAKPKDALFVDTKTGEVIIAPEATQLPALNPNTGTATLLPGLFCPKCRKWYPTPPIEVLNRNPGAASCPEDKTPLNALGPWPGEAGFQP